MPVSVEVPGGHELRSLRHLEGSIHRQEGRVGELAFLPAPRRVRAVGKERIHVPAEQRQHSTAAQPVPRQQVRHAVSVEVGGRKRQRDARFLQTLRRARVEVDREVPPVLKTDPRVAPPHRRHRGALLSHGLRALQFRR